MENLELNQNNQNGTASESDTNTTQTPQAPRLLREYLKSQKRNGNEIESYIEQGRTIYMPKNERKKRQRVQQLKDLVECYDDINGDGKELISLELIDTSKVETMRFLFCDSLRKNYKGIEKWDTSKVISLEGMFMKTDFNEDISGQEVTRNNRTYNSWDVSKVQTFESMFYRASKFNQPIGQKWHTKSAKNMISMFRFATSFNNGGKQFLKYKWIMDKVEWVQCMFWGAEKFNAPGLNEWNMSSVTKCQIMFNGAKAFNQPLDKWDLKNAVDLGHMFNKAESFNRDLSAWGERLGKAQHMRRMFADTKSLKIDFLSSWDIPDDSEHIIKGSGLEKLSKQVRLSNFIVSELVGEKKFTGFGKNAEFLGFWMPKNIQEKFSVYLARYNDDDELEKADEKSWEFAFCEVFEHIFLIEKIDKDGDKIDEDWAEKVSEFNIYQAHKKQDFEDFDENKTEKIFSSDELEIYLAPQNIWIINNAAGSKNKILSIVNALILIKAYKAKMGKLDEIAKNYTSADDLQKSYKNLTKILQKSLRI